MVNADLLNPSDMDNTSLTDGQYQVGILSYYVQGATGIIRSEFNSQLFTCVVNSGGVPTDCSPQF